MTKDIYLQWQAPQFKHYDKKFGWYAAFWVIAAILIFLPLFQKDYFGAITVAIIAVLAFLFSLHRPRPVLVSLSDSGIFLDELEIPYKAIKHFWILDNDNHKLLNLESTTLFNRTVSIELNDQDPEEVREILKSFLEEHETAQETFSQKITHKLKF